MRVQNNVTLYTLKFPLQTLWIRIKLQDFVDWKKNYFQHLQILI